jgi:hypothetical protein
VRMSRKSRVKTRPAARFASSRLFDSRKAIEPHGGN